MPAQNHYKMLGVAPNADAATVRAAYLAKAREVHPDRHVGEPAALQAKAARVMQQVNEAWAVVGNPTLRSRYDADLAYAARRPSNGTTPSAQAGPTRQPQRHMAPGAAPGRTTAASRGPGYARPIPPDTNRGTPHRDAAVGVRVAKVMAMLVLVGVLVGIAVYFAATTISSKVSRPSIAPGPTEQVPTFVQVGQCVEISAVLSVVSCNQLNDGFVSSIIGIDQRCPEGTGQIPIDPVRVACVTPR